MDENGARRGRARGERDATRRVGNGIAPENGERLNEPGTGRRVGPRSHPRVRVL